MKAIWIGILVLLVILAAIGYYYFGPSIYSQQITQQNIEAQADQALEKELEEALSSASTSDLETELFHLS